MILVSLWGRSGASVTLDEEEVIFRLEKKDAEKVFLVGDFNGWNPTIDRLALVDGVFEIRLFLLPGRYRYRFLADGVSISDPDNRYVDGGGNSYFILRETEGVYQIVYSETVDMAGFVRTVESTFSGRAYLLAGRDRGSLLFGGHVLGTVNERALLDLDFGFEYDVPESGAANGKAFLLRGSAGYKFDRGLLGAFYRSRDLGLDDPVSLFGLVGPYDYPLSLFCRGTGFKGTMPLGLETNLFYASRIQGYRSGLESDPDTTALCVAQSPFNDRDLTDSDLIGLSLGRDFGAIKLSYLFRRDHRPKKGAWNLHGIGDYTYRGYEKDFFNGLLVNITGGNVTLDVEYIWGNTFLSARERCIDDSGGTESIGELNQIWERGHRFYTGIEFRENALGLRLAYIQTTLEGEGRFREGRPDGIHDEMLGGVSVMVDKLRCSLSGKVESFSAMNTGEIFWVQRMNFWLDGDELVTGLFPFVYSSSLYEVKIAFLWGEQEDFEYPFREALDISLLQRSDAGGEDRVVRELQLSKGFPLHKHLNFLCDFRYIHYDHEEWTGKRDFLDVYLSLNGEITASSWYAVGFGVNPFLFDRWYYHFSGYGRENYLLDQGLYDVFKTSSTADLMNALRDAEEELSEEWMITIEAGIRF